MKKTIAKRVLLIAAIVTAIIPVCLLAWDYADPPMMWHKEAQENKRVILEYAEKHFPEAKIIKQVYESSKLNFSANPHDYILFEQDGVRFSIWANDGMFLGENYLSSKGSQYIKREIIEKFLKPRNINIKYNVYFDGPDPIGSVEDYIGYIDVYINDFSYFSNYTPVDAGWFYDFYVYWQEESNLKNYHVFMQYEANEKRLYKLNFTQDSKFENANMFYAAFQCKELN